MMSDTQGAGAGGRTSAVSGSRPAIWTLKTRPDEVSRVRRGIARPDAHRDGNVLPGCGREDRSVLDLLDGKFTFLNERLAKFYGSKGLPDASSAVWNWMATSARG